ncbi:polysaccharide biosynthesis/export family protein [Prosthecobacter sp.]|uniref:polysaccharide biosynthesis/export family protein n=1 Tax=Prosthecobacter sp. TaxID=1965333 RepID=UPI002ABC1B20|nr:polysaccharide biosynthesis/export family protein [Prosthecobacter sp.]MDZ4404685.1 polysaccharide biosynthesis/export family protein [Prosthecobacter sp.]
MKKLSCLVFALSIIVPCLNAQDPGFRSPEPSRAARQATASTTTGSLNAGAAVLTSMDVLDNNRPISSGDTISIRILEDRRDALQQVVAVTGEVQAPYVGLVNARGKTCRDLAYTIKRELEKNFFKNATVVIAIDKLNERTQMEEREVDLEFYVMFGFVARQGKYDLPSNEDISISQAILRAGGFAQFANKEKVKVIRKTPQGNKTILVNVDGIMRRGDLERDIYIRKDDVIIVEELNWNF